MNTVTAAQPVDHVDHVDQSAYRYYAASQISESVYDHLMAKYLPATLQF